MVFEIQISAVRLRSPGASKVSRLYMARIFRKRNAWISAPPEPPTGGSQIFCTLCVCGFSAPAQRPEGVSNLSHPIWISDFTHGGCQKFHPYKHRNFRVCSQNLKANSFKSASNQKGLRFPTVQFGRALSHQHCHFAVLPT